VTSVQGAKSALSQNCVSNNSSSFLFLVSLLLVSNTGVSDTGAMGINDGVLSE
jgi:hypothetical protein